MKLVLNRQARRTLRVTIQKQTDMNSFRFTFFFFLSSFARLTRWIPQLVLWKFRVLLLQSLSLPLLCAAHVYLKCFPYGWGAGLQWPDLDLQSSGFLFSIDGGVKGFRHLFSDLIWNANYFFFVRITRNNGFSELNFNKMRGKMCDSKRKSGVKGGIFLGGQEASSSFYSSIVGQRFPTRSRVYGESCVFSSFHIDKRADQTKRERAKLKKKKNNNWKKQATQELTDFVCFFLYSDEEEQSEPH